MKNEITVEVCSQNNGKNVLYSSLYSFFLHVSSSRDVFVTMFVNQLYVIRDSVRDQAVVS